MGKFDKKEHCEYCGGKLDAKNRNKKFCSDKCRVYWNRENKLAKGSVIEKMLPIVQNSLATTATINQLKEKQKIETKSEEKRELTPFEIYRNKKLGLK